MKKQTFIIKKIILQILSVNNLINNLSCYSLRFFESTLKKMLSLTLAINVKIFFQIIISINYYRLIRLL